MRLLPAIAAVVCVGLPAAAGQASKCAGAATNLQDKFQIGALSPHREADCPLVVALSEAMDLLDERDFPNTQARVEPLKPIDYGAAVKRAMRAATRNDRTRNAACALFLDIAARATDEASIAHLSEVIAAIDGASGTCAKRLAAPKADPAASRKPAAVFETPIEKKIVPLAADALNPQAKRTRTCFYYPGIMVKEIDWGEVGAERQSLVPIPPNAASPACGDANAHEIAIAAPGWSGYYHGKIGYAFFFDDGDGVNSGLPFIVVSAQGKVLLEDSYDGGEFHAAKIEGTNIFVRFRRTWMAPCSLFTDPAGCWKTVMAQTGLPADARPDCGNAYKKQMVQAPKYAADTAKTPSMIAYEAEARISLQKATVSALPGPVTCWLPD